MLLLWISVGIAVVWVLFGDRRNNSHRSTASNGQQQLQGKPLTTMPIAGMLPGGCNPTGLMSWLCVPIRLLSGSVVDIVGDPLRCFERFSGELGPLFRYKFFGDSVIVVADPEAAKQVLMRGSRKYRKEEDEIVKDVVGNGLLLSNGPLWARQRRTMQPVFGHSSLVPMYPGFNVAGRELTSRWESLLTAVEGGGNGGSSVVADVHSHMTQLTLDVIGRIAFDVDFLAQSTGARADLAKLRGEAMVEPAELPKAVTTVLRITESRLFQLLPIWKLPWSNETREMEAAKGVLFDAIKRAVTHKAAVQRAESERAAVGDSEAKHDRKDLVDSLLLARDPETGEQIDETQLRDELVTFLIAGHETTAAMLTFLFFELAWHPEFQEQLRTEVDAVFESLPTGSDSLSADDVSATSTPFMEMCMRETLRLYPSVSMMTTRELTEDDVIAGYLVPAGTMVEVWPWLLHRNPKLWEQPHEFIPQRHTRELTEARDTFQFLPFGAGPRNCIGKKLAWMESKVVICHALRSYRVRPQTGTKRSDMHPELTVTLRPSSCLLEITPR